MPNVNLNPGGLIGALIGGAAVCAIVLLLGGTPRAIARIGIVGLIAGAVAGNFLWAKLFQPPPAPPSIHQ